MQEMQAYLMPVPVVSRVRAKLAQDHLLALPFRLLVSLINCAHVQHQWQSSAWFLPDFDQARLGRVALAVANRNRLLRLLHYIFQLRL